ncbi:serine/threonine protein kinase [Miniimonas arenae]|uniref:non-specific serine/threonine protein kinase n=1 Tax=Miniimonas arenae TaxID=676201 RepID=A0A5C5BFP1_9MICO|nr:serine/threonine-protein kinase [Miniimonas arenae]TNU76108.1 serine/threonine protein kinase [Miniimonas arenae]
MSEPALGRYRLLSVLGVGSFATVHRARDDRLESDVVVKVLAENHSLNLEIRERFIAEGRSLRRVVSPHVVTVHDIGESERGQPYLVLSLADRGTLAARVRELRSAGWTATADDVLAVARALAAALSAVHAAQLVHRDLSPENVLLTSVAGLERGDAPRAEATGGLVRADERLVLADLGLCKDLALSSGLTVAGGTTGFRPPEQRDAGVVDMRADLWALSALVRWLAADAALPEELAVVLGRSLADDPERRHPDVRAWLTDVERALAPQPVGSDPGDAATSGGRDGGTSDDGAAHPPVRRLRRARVLTALGALVLVLALGVTVGLLVARSSGPGDATATARIAISGPVQAQVGVPVTFEADVDGATTWVWTLPSGEFVPDAESVTVTASAPEAARVVLSALDDAGRELRTEHGFRVTQ